MLFFWKIINYIIIFYLYTLKGEMCQSTVSLFFRTSSVQEMLHLAERRSKHWSCFLWVVYLLVVPQLFWSHKHRYSKQNCKWSFLLYQERVIRCDSDCIWNTKLWILAATRPGRLLPFCCVRQLPLCSSVPKESCKNHDAEHPQVVGLIAFCCWERQEFVLDFFFFFSPPSLGLVGRKSWLQIGQPCHITNNINQVLNP